MNRWVVFSVFFLLVAVSVARGAPEVNVGVIGLNTEIPLYVAMERGFLKEQAIEVKLHTFRSSGEMLAPLATNRLQVVIAGISPAVYNAVARGMSIILVAGASVQIPGHDVEFLMLRPDLKDRVKSLADLKGRKVALNAPMTGSLYSFVKPLEGAGLTVKDVEIVYIPFPDMSVAFGTKAIDMASMVEPFASLAEAKGLAIKWKKASDLVRDPYYQVAAVYFNKDWARENREVAKNFLGAWMRGAREVFEAFERGTNKDQVISWAIKYGLVKDRALHEKMESMYANPNGYLDKKSIEDQINWYFPRGFITHKIPIDQVVDDSFVRAALREVREVPVVHTGH